MKAIPFSTFCAVLPGTVAPAPGGGGGAALRLKGEPRIESFLRLDKNLYGTLVPALQRRPAVRAHLRVETHPTVTDEGGEPAFPAVARGRQDVVRLRPPIPAAMV